MTDIFEEVDESLRKDRLGDLWKRYSIVVYAVIAVAILGVGGFEFWKSQRAGAVEVDAKVFDTAVTALDNKDLATAKSTFAQLGQKQGGFATLANHMLAGVEKESTNDKAAVAKSLAAAAARDTGVYGDLATLKEAYAKADTAKLAELETVIAPLIKKGGYFGSMARELVAAKAAAEGDVERARSEYQALSLEIEAPDALKQRVSRALLALPPKPATASAPTTPAPAQPPAKPGQQ